MDALRVLVVEDDALITMLLAEVLAAMGHEVCATAATEADAVTAASRHKPDLMIIDAGLGRGSGVSAVEQILRAGPLAHVFMSDDAARVRDEDQRKTGPNPDAARWQEGGSSEPNGSSEV
jgi:two-component system, response regulator PdtaR